MPTTTNSSNHPLSRELARDIVRLIDRGPKFNCAACGQRYDIDNLDFCEQCLYPICGSCTVEKRDKQAARTADRCPRCPGELRSIDCRRAFKIDQLGVRTGNAAHNFAVVRHFALNLIRLAPVKRKGGIKVRRLIAATSDPYRAELFGLV